MNSLFINQTNIRSLNHNTNEWKVIRKVCKTD